MQQGLTPLNPNAYTGNSAYSYNQQQQGYYGLQQQGSSSYGYGQQQQQGYYNNNHHSRQGSSSMNSSAMNLSPIMPCSSQMMMSQTPSGVILPNTTNVVAPVVSNMINANDSSIDSNTNTDATHKSATSINNQNTSSSSGSHSQRVQGQAVRRRKYTHNPYASSNASSRASSTCSADNSAPSTPMSNSFATVPHHHQNATSNIAAAGAYNNNNSVGVSIPSSFNMMGGMQQSSTSTSSTSNNNMYDQTQQQMMMMMGAGYSLNGQQQQPQQVQGGRRQQQQQQPQMNNNMMQQQSSQQQQNDVLMFPGGSVHSLKSATEQFEAMRGQIVANSCNQRGRHVVVAMIRLQQPEYNDIIFDELSAGWGALISDMNGCHVARTFVETIPSDKIQQLCESMSRDVVLHMCSASQYSRRVLQSMFENHNSEPHLQAIIDHVSTGAVALATTQQGCISIMRILEFSKPAQREKLMNVLSPHLAALAADPYGNYVLQTITQSLGSNEMVCHVLEKAFEGSWVALSCNKFASNVMEKIIRIAAETPSSTARKTIIEELVCNTGNLSIIIVDGFGNFVLQAIIDSCNNVNEFRKIGDRIRPLLASSPYGHKIEGKLKSKRIGGNNSRSGSQEADY